MAHLLFDAIKREFNLTTDTELAEFVGDTRSSISIIKSGSKRVNAALILKIHKATKWPVSAIEAMLPKWML